ncbi:MAG: hypothetical protein ACI33K_02585 [Clostridiaceae bacterium]
MEHKLIAESFIIKLDIYVFESDISYPVNTSLKIFVESNGFSAATNMDIDIKDLAGFAIGLRKLYYSLKGSARLQEPYGSHNYFEFLGIEKEYINVNGSLKSCSESGFIQELNFSNKINQSYLKDFQEKLSASYQEYLR